MEKRKHVFWELTLLIGSVFVFRTLWIIMDRTPFFNTWNNLWTFLVVGIVLTALGFYQIVHSDKGWAKSH